MHEKPVFICVCIQQSLVAAFKKSCELGNDHPRDYGLLEKENGNQMYLQAITC